MQVRKFEARTIKEAIELVKLELGPDAIILSAKENVKKFGLMGESSVEVTAAVSETQLHAKKLAERKMNLKTRESFVNSTAKRQRKFIDASTLSDAAGHSGGMEMYASDQQQSPAPKPQKRAGITQARYVDIDEEEMQAAPATQSTYSPNAARQAAATTAALRQATQNAQANEAAHMAAQNAAAQKASAQAAAYAAEQNAPAPARRQSSSDSVQVMALKNEIDNLKAMVERFQKVPQNFISMHPGAEEGIPFELSPMFKKLEESGLAINHICDILRYANDTLPPEHKKKRAFVEGWVIRYMLDQIIVNEKPMQGRFHVFFGATGQGKTSTVVKMASHLVLKEKKKVAVFTGDIFKVGAKEQLKTYCQILNIPFGVMKQASDWREYEPLLKNMDYIFFDTAGTNLKSGADLDRLRAMMPITNDKVALHYVQSALARDADAFEIADRFKILGFQDVIFTRLDEAVQQGLIYNFQKRYDVPLHSFGIGSHIPEDFEFASKERVVDMIFNLSKTLKERGQS
ncbi:MAG: flagellar biosynthesis protein FlhF [Bdellovibrionota bacterium]